MCLLFIFVWRASAVWMSSLPVSLPPSLPASLPPCVPASMVGAWWVCLFICLACVWFVRTIRPRPHVCMSGCIPLVLSCYVMSFLPLSSYVSFVSPSTFRRALCLFVCLWMYVCLSVCLSVRMSVCPFVSFILFVPSGRPPLWSASLSVCLPLPRVYLYVCVRSSRYRCPCRSVSLQIKLA